MKLVLDENIIEFSAKVQNAAGKMDATCAIFLTKVLERCETIYCSKKLYDQYERKLYRLITNYPSADYIVRILLLLRSKGAVKFDYSPSTLGGDEKHIPPDDIYLIRLMVHTNSILVTNDDRLKERLNQSGLISKYCLTIKKPEEVFDQILK